MGKTARNFVVATTIAAVVYAGATGTFGDIHILHDPDNIYNDRTLTITEEEKEALMNSLESELGYDVAAEKEDDYLLLSAIMENNNLSEDEKAYFYDFGEMFYENPYLDREKAYHNLKNVSINYNATRDYNEWYVSGSYDYKNNEIKIFDDSEAVRGHEIIHCIFNVRPEHLDNYFIEGMTELLYNEYFEDIPFVEVNSYPFEISAVKMLCDVCGSDVVLKAYSESSMKPIIDELANYSSREDAKHNLDLLNDVFVVRSDNQVVTHYTDYDDMLDYLEKILINKYGEGGFEHNSFKYNKSLFMNLFYDNSLDRYLDIIENTGIGTKAYFSNKLKEDYNYFHIEPCDYTFSYENPVFQKVQN